MAEINSIFAKTEIFKMVFLNIIFGSYSLFDFFH